MVKERVLLVGARLKGEERSSSLEELKGLAETAGGEVRGVVMQNLEKYHPATLIGPGKVEEIKRQATAERVWTVIFDNDLSPAQQRNLEKAVDAKIVDRTRLILDIFASRARTREGALQVELAQLEYMMPRLTGRGHGFSQQAGTTGGIGTRGPGERKLEYDRRRIRDRISQMKKGIEGIRRERDIQRKKRLSVPYPLVALVGYTNVGKSTLLNALSGAKVYADDRLFATLDPTTRRVRLPAGGWALWSDTVGFIQNLPTSLVAAFRSTLEEARLADCIVHVVDAASPLRDAQMKVVHDVLKELDAGDIPVVTAYNKADLLPPSARHTFDGEVVISAGKKEGFDGLLDRVEEVLNRRWKRQVLKVPDGKAAFLPEIYRTSQVVGKKHRDGHTELELRVTPENYARLKSRLDG